MSYLEAVLPTAGETFPARRSSPSELEGRYEIPSSEEAELLVHLLEHPAIMGLDRREWGFLAGLLTLALSSASWIRPTLSIGRPRSRRPCAPPSRPRRSAAPLVASYFGGTNRIGGAL